MSSPEGTGTEVDTTAEDEAAQAASAAAALEAEAEGDAGEGGDSDGELPEAVKKKIAKANREAQNLRAKIKELEPLAQEAKTLRESQMSEVEKLTTQLAEREAELVELRTDRIRAQAGTQAGLAPDMWEFITSSDPEEALDQAKRLAERLAPPEPGQTNLRQGARGTTAKPPMDANTALRIMAGYQ